MGPCLGRGPHRSDTSATPAGVVRCGYTGATPAGAVSVQSIGKPRVAHTVRCLTPERYGVTGVSQRYTLSAKQRFQLADTRDFHVMRRYKFNSSFEQGVAHPSISIRSQRKHSGL
jgi:hypothetical protein